MNLGGINGYSDTNSTVSSLAAAKTNTSKDANTTNSAVSAKEYDGVIYEPSSSNATHAYDKTIVDKLKQDAEERTSQLRSLVEDMFTKQGTTYDDSTFWNMIREGNYQVDPEVAAKAAEDVSEDGYWGVKQTSERMVSFAKAITGGDTSKAAAMKAAIKEGYKAAAKMWGGELPEISKKTLEATMKGIDDWVNGTSTN